MASAQAQLNSDVTNLNKATIRSPVTGVVLSRQVEPGQTVAASFNTPTLFTIAEDLTGEVVLKMYKGSVTAVQKRSINSLYSEDFATFGADEVYDQSHAEGFIRLYTLASRIRAMKEQHQAIGGDHTHG